MDPLKLIFKISILEANKQTKAKKKKPIVFASFILAWYKSKRVNYWPTQIFKTSVLKKLQD